MKVAPVSADLLIKIGLAVGVIGALVWAAKKVGGAAGAAGQTVVDAAWQVSPTNNNNVIYRAANTITGGDNSSNSIGSRLYDWFHPPEIIAPKPYVIPQDFGVTDPNAPW